MPAYTKYKKGFVIYFTNKTRDTVIDEFIITAIMGCGGREGKKLKVSTQDHDSTLLNQLPRWPLIWGVGGHYQYYTASTKKERMHFIWFEV